VLIIALNGFLGARKDEVDMTEVVDRVVERLPRTDHVEVVRGHGGAGALKFRKLYKRILRESKDHDTLLLAGKSYGGHWCCRLLWKLASQEKLDRFSNVGLVTVDPSYVLHRMQKKVKQIPDIGFARNVHQYGPRSGYRLGPPAENIVVKGTHANIDRKPTVTNTVYDLVHWGHVKDCA
jgi:hypothetical protein